MHRVVITGIGVVAPNGIGVRAFGEAIAEGRSGVGYIESFDTTGLPIKIAGEVKDFDVSPYLGPHKKNGKLMSRAMRFAVGAAAMAVEATSQPTGRCSWTRPRMALRMMMKGPVKAHRTRSTAPRHKVFNSTENRTGRLVTKV